MKKVKFLFFVVLLCALPIACINKGKQLAADEIEQQFGNNVVLVQNTYYFSADFGNMTFYFTGIDRDGDLENATTNDEDITTVVAYGTGFFISETGEVVTNEHVVAPSIDSDVIKDNFVQLKNFFRSLCEDEITNYTDTLSQLHNIWLRTESGSYEEEKIERLQQLYTSKREELQEMLHRISNLNASKINLQYHSNVGIALNNTFITKNTDFMECVLTKEDSTHDLAVIQLKNKKTPEGCGFFNVKKAESGADEEPYDAEGNVIDVDNLKLGTKMYMIGFNLGPRLALTKDGIKAQITEGTISQNTDDVKMMYSIPALHGSSGSPVVDEYGNFVGVNFAGLDETQSFNYGIKAKHLRNLLGL